jgi:Phage late-transcription coactivator
MSTREEKNTFSIMIEQRAETQKVRHMEAIIDYCEESGLELEVAATLINSSLKSKIENEARELRFLPKSSKLPL